MDRQPLRNCSKKNILKRWVAAQIILLSFLFCITNHSPLATLCIPDWKSQQVTTKILMSFPSQLEVLIHKTYLNFPNFISIVIPDQYMNIFWISSFISFTYFCTHSILATQLYPWSPFHSKFPFNFNWNSSYYSKLYLSRSLPLVYVKNFEGLSTENNC